ncbi:ThuA domain-containing protein [Mucilaginibacter sp. PAMB04274]|uniref:ThuA domain-containing protein n=1 Tax=Mucilaginibacter sp. PAMB04274 TaxID=3138568 RepID=UPI0031F6BC4A
MKTAFKGLATVVALFALVAIGAAADAAKPKFKVIAFYTAKADLAHISFVHEANHWFPEMAKKYNFTYDSTNNWNNLNMAFLSKYQVVLFLDTRPEQPEQRAAFEAYMKGGGAWMGFHFAAFALSPSGVPQNWDWYHNEFLGSGQYSSNTWRPTSAVLRVENKRSDITKGLPATFTAAPNEWYRWEKNLRQNAAIEILLSVDTSSFPLGTGPKPNEIWHSGDYPVAWRNKNYRMVYVNMGHNDMDYEHKFDNTNRTLSYTFHNSMQNKFLLNALQWLGKR